MHSTTVWKELCAAQQAWRTRLLACLDKAQGHLNAADKFLYSDRWQRGVWSGQQAQARIAQALLALAEHGNKPQPPEEPTLEPSLPPDAVRALCERLASAPHTAAWRSWTEECQAAEQALQTAPPPVIGTVPQAQLEAGIERTRRYSNALQALQQTAQKALIEHFVTLRRGDWIALQGYGCAKVLQVQYLSVHLFVPAMARTDPLRAMVRLDLRRFPPYSPAAAPACPADHSPATAWLHAAAAQLEHTRFGVHCSDTQDGAALCQQLYQALDTITKAWWSTHACADTHIQWEQHAPQHVHRLQERVPPALAALLAQAWKECNALSLLHNNVHSPMAVFWGQNISLATLVQRIAQCLQAMQAVLAPHIGWEEGALWPGTGAAPTHQVIARTGVMLLLQPIDHLPTQEPQLVNLFDAYARPARGYTHAPSASPPPTPAWAGQWHTRWHWLAQHPSAYLGRDLCPCCGLPGVAGVDSSTEVSPLCTPACCLCGWQHDGGDWRAQRPSALYPDLSLALARKRCAFLGYAHLPSTADEHAPHPWLRPQAVVSKKQLLAAFDALVQQGAAPSASTLQQLQALWQDWLHSSDQGNPV